MPISTLKQFGFTELKIDVLFEYGDQQARLNKNVTLRVQIKNHNNTRELGTPALFGYAKDWTQESVSWKIPIDDTNSNTGQFTVIWSRVEIGDWFNLVEEFKVRNRTITVTALK